MKAKILMIAMMAICGALSFTACSDDDDEMSNHDRYQKAVTENVKANKKHDKAILLVAFGSTWQQAYDAFDATVEATKKQFPDYDVFLSFSSVICINRAAAGENVKPRNFYAPSFWLNAFADKDVQYKEIVIQSLQVIPGEEYKNVRDSYIKNFANNFYGDLDDEYLSKVKIYLGTPLMAEDEDVDALAKVLYNSTKSKLANNSVVAFMGHGNPEGYDYYGANVRYTELENALQTLSGTKQYYVGTVDMPENYKTDVLLRMQDNGFTSGTVYCYPLMSIAGDHAHNDMAGDDDAWEDGYELNEEGEVEDTSWKCYFARCGYTCNDAVLDGCVIGLLENTAVRQLWIDHIKRAITNDYGLLDYYHSKNPE
ncbi:MAG: sirohydrochlorin cobaltochelatase [Bacteroidaceae bacterium]|jgi:Cobalamin biosynthesis protein CbiK, Co2+ chelatase|nr:sirohydrochlorin cobaltochelatase [Bacteroidaceae bacterium]